MTQAGASESRRARLIDCFVVRTTSDGAREFLLLRRAKGKIYAGSFRMVAGKVEANETAYEACVRELLEETGLVPLRLWAVPFVNRFYEWQSDQVHEIPVFLAEVPASVELRLDGEHDLGVWVGQDEALKLLDWPAQREGLLASGALLDASNRLKSALQVEWKPT